VTNTGASKGREVVQLYLTDLYASIVPDTKRLKRFAKLELQPNQSEKVSFSLSKQDFSFIGRNNKPNIEPGKFRIAVGELSETFILRR
jgi:beta-glucosidase